MTFGYRWLTTTRRNHVLWTERGTEIEDTRSCDGPEASNTQFLQEGAVCVALRVVSDITFEQQLPLIAVARVLPPCGRLWLAVLPLPSLRKAQNPNLCYLLRSIGRAVKACLTLLEEEQVSVDVETLRYGKVRNLTRRCWSLNATLGLFETGLPETPPLRYSTLGLW
jgi:hypothetical protein